MPSPFSIVNQVTREELLSADLTSAQTLESAQAQDVLRQEALNDESRVNPNTPYVSTFGGDPIEYGASYLPFLAPGGGFTIAIQQGQVFLDTGAFPSMSGGDSPYQVLRWEAQSLTFAAPDPANPRIDLVYAAPGTQLTDNQSRNILLDPVARTVAPAVVPKRVNPIATLVIVTGTPGAAPTVPALPAGTAPLYEVFVPAAAASSANFLSARQCNRRAVYPMSAAHGILQGVEFTTNLVDESAATSDLFVGFTAGSGASKVVIDGEVIAFDGGDSFTGPLPLIVSDAGGNSPFAVAAPANNDKPYYIYACGGRHLRQGRTGNLAGGVGYFPVCFVESLVAPTKDGRPSAAITTPRGVTQAGALYVGVGFVVKNSTRRKGCVWAGDWVSALSGSMAGPLYTPAGTTFAGFNDNATRTLTAGPDTFTLAAAPAVSTRARLSAVYAVGAGGDFVTIGNAHGGVGVYGEGVGVVDSASGGCFTTFDHAFPAGALTVGVQSSTHIGATFKVWATSYNMRVKRYAAAV